jgi:hypothetical protein
MPHCDPRNSISIQPASSTLRGGIPSTASNEIGDARLFAQAQRNLPDMVLTEAYLHPAYLTVARAVEQHAPSQTNVTCVTRQKLALPLQRRERILHRAARNPPAMVTEMRWKLSNPWCDTHLRLLSFIGS